MRKISAYGRQKRRTDQAKAIDELRSKIKSEVRALRLNASMHAWNGEDAKKLVSMSGQLCYVVAYAAAQAGVTAEQVDMRILRGMSGALADLAENPKAAERHRVAIQSGIKAIDRLLPLCDDLHLLVGAADLDRRLCQVEGVRVEDFEKALGVAV